MVVAVVSKSSGHFLEGVGKCNGEQLKTGADLNVFDIRRQQDDRQLDGISLS